ncbi:hypothetical protein [Psychrobacter sp. UBA3962]|uniref:hypothetical protein n=1 Tax=Psychrobacter sp. UBA3962 TaxID=1947352 RepID=UPI0025D3E2A9|nr:hypothetical protein [Psychrobacter sp. UBA3962]
MPRQYPVMLYLDYLINFAVAHNQDEYDKLVEQGYTTHDKVKPEPEPVNAGNDDLLAAAYGEIEKLEDEVELLRQKLAVYESAKDANQDGVVSYDEMTSSELQALLRQRGVSFKSRDSKDALIKLAQDSE